MSANPGKSRRSKQKEVFSQFGSELDESTQKILKKGKIAVALLNQSEKKPLIVAHQVIMLFAYTRNFLNDISVNEVKEISKKIIEHIEQEVPEFIKEITESNMWSEDSEKKCILALSEFFKK